LETDNAFEGNLRGRAEKSKTLLRFPPVLTSKLVTTVHAVHAARIIWILRREEKAR